jgi:dTDP-4-amino-4,6-dideoxygalactose transaminase
MDPLLELAARRGLWVLEDCAQAQGAQYKGKPVGSMGHFGAFSFFPSQNLTVLGDGGCLVTNDSGLADKLRMLRDHGRKDKYLHEFAGFDLRFSEIHAAIGRAMLSQLDACNVNRRMIADRYQRLLRGLVVTPVERPWARAVYHRYVIRCPRRDELQQFLLDRGIETGVHYPVPNHRQPAVTRRFPGLRPLPHTETAVKEILSLPIHGEMTLEEADRVCSAIAEFYGRK